VLTHLHIRNYALISHLDIHFHEGFSVLTGETGAGKSIILGALNLVMGARADTKTITEGEDKCVIEATFAPAAREDAPKELQFQDTEIIIRRELNQNGRSRSFVNDEVVTQAELKALARELIDIHSQHESLMLGDDLFQIQIVDSIAGNDHERDTYSTAYAHYHAALQALRDCEQRAAKAHDDAEYVAFQWQQLEDAHLQSGEMEELEEEEYRLAHAEEIQASLSHALQYLDSDEHGALSLIHNTRIGDADTSLAERLESVEIELKDIIADIHHLYDRTERNPMRLEQVQERMSMLQTLMKKHRLQTIDELISLHEELGAQMQQLSNFDEDIARLRKEVEMSHASLTTAAEALTMTRQSVTDSIASHLVTDMQRLGVKHANVAVQIQPTDDFTETGKDDVQIMFAANLNQSLRRVAEVASGGEISRLMLCIKALIASTKGLPTIIFDEIDTGVSGAIASQMGEIMRQIAASRQVISITHLPQVASKGEYHYLVYKEDTSQRTETHIRELTTQEHETEVEKMREI
jgi:DNA repair protein RecN (Recombination protein N)